MTEFEEEKLEVPEFDDDVIRMELDRMLDDAPDKEQFLMNMLDEVYGEEIIELTDVVEKEDLPKLKKESTDNIIYIDPPYSTLKFDEKLRDHLSFNFIPPVTSNMVEPCKEAINALRENEPERMIKVGDFYLPASEIVEDLKLHDMI
jgi:16S rRNA G966 N2-methylase RsmD